MNPSPTPAMVSSSQARCGPANTQGMLLMARELLRYRVANDLYNDWLARIAELVTAPGEAPASSHSLRPLPSLAGDMAHDAPPPPLHGMDPKPRLPSAIHRTGGRRAMKKSVRWCSGPKEKCVRF